MDKYKHLNVEHIERLTPNAVKVTFELPEALKEEFAFTPGQYITIKTRINGEEIRRSYSICSAANAEQLSVGIKKIHDGLFSKYANDELKAGVQLEVHPPEGRFTFDASKDEAETVVAFAAGSGITPIMSIMHSVLSETDKNFILVYGNKKLEETMFHKEIAAMAKQYKDRFQVQFVYSREQNEDALFGRIERSTVNYILKNKVEKPQDCLFYLCGPETMINNVSDALVSGGIAKDAVKFELFTSGEDTAEVTGDLPEGKTKVTVVVDDEEYALVMDKKERVLDAVLKEDIDAPYSCQGGICSSCIARVTEGKAEMVKNQILTDSELEEGLILTCQAHPTTSTLALDYDDV
ncbi:ferredoxin--NADP reductase [Robertkochia sediminum]|uniref:ferredoxin--NADP reductase n=1 Tax=Robertkochia sediminum TaxID=2785326 RepID=UPI0019318E80|nr:ferredoxin--NADP reductase [Robertkochia sediminum]MBL7471771.1 ferredoxin--NADP reductase [Robertkochia sediminum]